MSLLFLASSEVFKRRKGGGPFLGEVLASEFITGASLAQAVGLTAGEPMNNNEPWLKFKDPVDGKIKYIAKKPIRVNVSWNSINNRGAATGTAVSINGQSFIVRLLKTLPDEIDVAVANGGFDHPITHGSEWNRLMYHITGKPFNDSGNTLASESIDEGDWARYIENDLGIGGDGGSYYTLCQEKTTAGDVFVHGFQGVSFLTYGSASFAAFVWRPVLELVE